MPKYALPTILIATNIIVGHASDAAPVPSSLESLSFFKRFHSIYYINIAADLQSMPAADRNRRLTEIASDTTRPYDLFVLCRMLYDPRPGLQFKRPSLGGASFVGNASHSDDAYRRWPLEPITIRDHLPILVVQGYALGGGSPNALEYLEYCNANGVWTLEKYRTIDLVQRRNIIESFVKSLGKVSDFDKSWLLAQADDK